MKKRLFHFLTVLIVSFGFLPGAVLTGPSQPAVAAAPAPTALTKISPDNNPLPAFKWDGATANVTYEVSMDSGNWTNIGSRVTYIQPTILGMGIHAFSVRARDSLGNLSPVATLSFVVSVAANLADTRIAFVSDRDGNQEIYVMDPNGAGQTRLTFNPAYDTQPVWSPNGSRMAFASLRDSNWELYAMNADGSSQANLTQNAADDRMPSWSPDGSRIAFASARNGNWEIYVMNANGSVQTRLTTNSANDTSPAWSPDGARIAFVSTRDGNTEIYVMNIDGSNQTRITANSADDTSPVWSPDGSRIAFASLRDSNWEIYTMNADGSGQTRRNHKSNGD